MPIMYFMHKMKNTYWSKIDSCFDSCKTFDPESHNRKPGRQAVPSTTSSSQPARWVQPQEKRSTWPRGGPDAAGALSPVPTTIVVLGVPSKQSWLRTRTRAGRPAPGGPPSIIAVGDHGEFKLEDTSYIQSNFKLPMNFCHSCVQSVQYSGLR